jgi:hypothetical protein
VREGAPVRRSQLVDATAEHGRPIRIRGMH